MLGAVIIVIVLVVVLPITFLMAGGLVAALLGETLRQAGRNDHADSELLDLNR